MIQIEIKSAPLEAAMAAISRRIAHKADLLDDVGAALAENVRMTFVMGASPYGVPWAPLRHRKGQPLRDTGRLMNSITHRVVGNTVEVGTNVEYAPTHQFGARMGEYGRYYQLSRLKYDKGDFRRYAGSRKGHPIPWGNVPARPFLPNQAAGLPAAWEQEITALVGRFLAAPGSGAQ